MSKPRTVYACQGCGAQSPRWLGRCPDCNEWNTYVEERLGTDIHNKTIAESGSKPLSIADIKGDVSSHVPIGLGELDRVLGGGVIPGSLVLIGGDPGIGKSTIIMQALSRIAAKGSDVLYISGEESAAQIKLRADRMGISDKNFIVFTENRIEEVLEQTRKARPRVLAIDSIQTIYTSDLASAPGTIGQVRESAAKLLTFAKQSGVATFLIGHVTKEGSIAGPKVLEHMVDTVLYFEGERGHPYRILRTMKNRFGSTNEIGVFEMTGTGLKEVTNPSGIFLSQMPKAAAGSVVVTSLEGSRPMLLEVQALVTSSGFATPRRTSIGFDSNRLALLVAVLEKVRGLELKNQDIFLNVAGGMRINEPAADLGVIAAIESSFKNRPVDHETVIIGEVGLTGEIRGVMGLDLRLKEAQKLGLKRAIVPKTNTKSKPAIKMDIYGTASVEESFGLLS